MREVEVKAVVDDWDARRDRVVEAGAQLSFAGRLEDRRYDTASHDLASRGEVLRVRVYRGDGDERAEIGWKGPTSQESGYKVREELGASTPDAAAMALILRRLGFVVCQAIDREIMQYDMNGTIIRFERYPRMDDLVEVEGTPAGIERAVAVLGIPRSEFTAERLPKFVRRFEERTGRRAAICDADLGDGSPDPCRTSDDA
ncbi:MAG TPA: class IV adenylate cyclase [Gemmatimonadaceae bacterium]|jgi:predicted adenylyl cyclase CyaB|nr:class IV adenylate cyclase [Gemmatimonadaceae bacterium]